MCPSPSAQYAPPEVVAPVLLDGVALALYPAAPSLGKGLGVVLEGVDVYNGKLIWSTPSAYVVYDPPAPCTADPTNNDFCVILSGTSKQLLLASFDARTGRLVAEFSGIQRRLGPGLYETSSTSPAIVSLDGGGIRWSVPLSHLFPGGSYSTNYGWSVATFGSVQVLSVGAVPKGTTADLAAQRSVGISAATGRALWRAAGGLWCGNIFPISTAYRCQESGTLTLRAGIPTLSRGARATLEGFDPATGQATWKFGVGGVASLLAGTDVVSRVRMRCCSTTRPAVDGGSTSPTASGYTFSESTPGWCTVPGTFSYSSSLGEESRLGVRCGRAAEGAPPRPRYRRARSASRAATAT